jgi:formate hydrogenlyase subunit 3/multisubunit Na+/H+ antiporter MnhD subunit
MNAALLKALLALVPVCLLFAWSLAVFLRHRTVWPLVQLVGAGGLAVVVLVHICEAEHLLPFMGWGSPHSVGHDLDFASALFGVTLFPIGLLSGLVTRHRTVTP